MGIKGKREISAHAQYRKGFFQEATARGLGTLSFVDTECIAAFPVFLFRHTHASVHLCCCRKSIIEAEEARNNEMIKNDCKFFF